MAVIVSPFGAGVSLQATTPSSGFVLQNATPTILTWTTPNDGQGHLVIVAATQSVTLLETGGQVSQSYTNEGNFGGGDTLFAGGSAAGGQIFTITRLLQPGSTLTISQSTALTSGAAIIWAQIWGK